MSNDKNHSNVAMCYNNIGMVYYAQGKYEPALKYMEKARIILEQKLGNDHPNTRLVLDNIKEVQ